MISESSVQARILIAEDEQVVALDLESQLDALGYQVVGLATTGPEVVQLAERTGPDLVLMDIQLHGVMDGIAAADEIRRRWQIPVIFVTAYANEEVLARAKSAGPYGYLTKPFRNKELNATVAVALHQHRLTRDVFVEHGWLRTLLAGMNDGVIATDIDGQVKYLNPMAEYLIGWKLPDALHRPIEEVYPLRTEGGEPVQLCQLRRVLATGQSIGRQRFILACERWITVEDSAAPIRDAQNRLTGAVTVIVDVTEQQRGERERERLMRELERSNTELARFSHAVSHDLQTPARTVRVLAELLSRRLNAEPSTETGRVLGEITGAAAGMQRLIESLLRYAQVGQGQLHREAVSPGEVLAEIRTVLGSIIAEHKAEIECGPLPVVSADRAQFEQLLQNLIMNAICYRQQGQVPRISISAQTIEEGWQFAVADTGEGIEPGQVERIFEPLIRLHGSEIPGSGIGLALCRAIVERHGGRIWVESPGLGCGTTFHFVICTS